MAAMSLCIQAPDKLTVQLLPMERWSLFLYPLEILHVSAPGLGIPTLTHEQAWASLEEHERCALHSALSPWWLARQLPDMCARFSQVSQLLAEHRCSPAKVSHA